MSESNKLKDYLPALAVGPLESPAQESKSFYNLPTSSTANTITEALGAGADIDDLPVRKKTVNHNVKLEVFAHDSGARRVLLENTTEQIDIIFPDIAKMSGRNKPAKKLFLWFLTKANEQTLLHNGNLKREYISFPIQELIEVGLYSTPQSARKGFDTGTDILTGITIKGHSRCGKGAISINAKEVLFTGARREKGQCFVRLNPHINWNIIAQYYTILPPYYFRLPNRASDLLYYIFYLARQHTKEIGGLGHFTISLRAIQQRLFLPSEQDNKDPYRTIKEPIEKAIEQIEVAHGETYSNTEFSMLLVCKENVPISEYLDNGYLKISLTGDFAAPFIKISDKTTDRISTKQKQKEQAKEKAIVMNLAKDIKKD